MASRKGKTLCISSAKGGVGKTITTLNLAGIYELISKKVLIVDLDLYGGGIATALNKPFEKSIYTMVDDINNNRYREFRDYVEQYDEYIDVLASPKDPRQANKIDAKYIDLILDRASNFYDVVLIDSNHILNEINVMMMDKVDEILFIVTNDPLDLKNLKSILSIFRDVNLKNYRVLLNDSRDPFKNYFTLYDVKNIIKTNVDYTLSKRMFIKDIDVYLMNGKIVTLDKHFAKVYTKDYSTLMTIAADALGDGGEENE